MGATGSAKSRPGLTATEVPRDLQGIGITEKVGEFVDKDLKFTDENGEAVTLAKYYDGTRPVVISLIYYACPGLCNLHLNGVIDSLKEVDWSAGDKFQYLAISFDPTEKPDLAAKKKKTYMDLYKRPDSEKGWHFLTADQTTIDQITKQLGFEYKWNEEAKEWSHASAAIVTTPQGKISRYLDGIMFEPKTFRMALVEATSGKIGTLVDRMIWYCSKYDPHLSKYSLYAVNVMKLGGIGIIILLATLMLPVWLRSRRRGQT